MNGRRIAIAILAASLAVTAAPAQHGSMSMSFFNDETTFAPALSRSDLEVFTRVLALKPAEQKAVEELHGAYAATLKQEGSAVKLYCAEMMEEAEVMEDQRLLEPAQKRITEWEKRSEQLKASFLEDLKVLLTREQEERWPIVERELRRLKKAGYGTLCGEGVDLIRLVGNLPVADAATGAVTALLEQYSQDLDRVLVAREQFLESYREKFDDLIKEDAQRARKVYEQSIGVHRAIVDVNSRYVRLICAELPSEAAAKLSDEFFNLSYRPLVKPTRTERYLRAAAELTTLTTEQREQVRQIVGDYDRARRALLERTAAEYRVWQETTLPMRLRKALGEVLADEEERMAQGMDPDHPLTSLRRERFEMDKAARSRLDAMLTAAQREALPDRASDAVRFEDWSPWGL